MEAKQTIRQFILKNYLFSTDDNALKNDVSLMQAGIIDSTGVLELIMFLEEQFGVKVADEEMTPENLDSVDRIVGFVDRKR
jgi:acyl carrier protein